MSSNKSKTKKGSKLTSKSLKKSKIEMNIPDAWINELKTMQINDASWRCLVSLFVEQCSETSIYTDHFNEAAIGGTRLSVKVISTLVVARTVIKNMVYEHSEHPMTPLALLCAEIYKVVGPDFVENIPTGLLAPLIKYIILEYKEWNKKVHEGIKNAEKGLDEYQHGLWNVPKKNSKSGEKSKTGNKSPTSEKPEKKAKAFTKLRKRGEEWKDIQWIDDAPLDGPNLYVVISSFYDVDLVLELLKLDVPLQAIVKVDLMGIPMVQEDVLECLAEFRRRSLPYLSTIKKESLSIHDINKILSYFWERLEYMKINPLSSVLFKDIMFLTFSPPFNNFNFQLKEFQEDIYNEISYFLYNTFDIIKFHECYTRKMDVKDLTDNNFGLLSKTKFYNSILDNIPHEVLTIPLILEALLTEICDIDRNNGILAMDEENQIEKIESASLNDFLITFLDNLNLKYDLPRNNGVNVPPKCLSEHSMEKSQPTVLIYSDDIKLRTFHLDSQLADFIVSRSNSILKTAWKSVLGMTCSYKTNSRLMELCNEIVRMHQETDNYNLYYLVYLIIINNALDSMLLLNASNKLSKQASIEMYLCDECKKDLYEGLYSQDGSSNISNYTTSSDNMGEDTIVGGTFFQEDLSSDILLQNIQSSNDNYNWLEKRYCPFTDELILIFHNIPHYFEEEWVGTLTTPVPLRDFVEYILDEQKTVLEEMVYGTYEELISENASSCYQQEIQILRKIQELSYTDMQFISHRSIKYEEMMKHEKNKTKSRKSSVTRKSTSQGENTKSSSLKKLKRGGVNKKEVTFTKKDDQEKTEVFLEVEEKQDYKFLGYNQGEPMRFQFNGYKKSKSLGRNCKVILEKVKKLYGDEYISMNIKMYGHNLFYTYKPESNELTPFHLVLSSGIVLYFGFPRSDESSSKKSRSLTQLGEFKGSQEQMEFSRNLLQNDVRYNINECRYCKIPLSYKLSTSTPSGLHVEVEQVDEIFYIRQTQLSKPFLCPSHGQEKFRCCLSSGFIMKFFIDGLVVALGPNGEIYKIYHNNRYSEIDHKNSGMFNPKNDSTETSPIENTTEQHFYSQPNNSSLNTYDYNFTTSDGKQYEVLGPNVQSLEVLLMTVHADIPNNCISSKRSDGVTTKHLGDGSLLVIFPDGSNVTSIPFQSKDIFCEWSNEEFVKWFVQPESEIITNITNSDEESIRQRSEVSNHSLNEILIGNEESQNKNSIKDEMRSLSSNKSISNKITYDKLDYAEDGFVVYNVSYKMEHINYGLVYFDSNNCQIDFELPQSTKITLQNDGSYIANIDSAYLAVDTKKIIFNKLNGAGGVEINNIINTSNVNKDKYDNTNEDDLQENVEMVTVQSPSVQDIEAESIVRKNNSSIIFYSADNLHNEVYIDCDLRFHNPTENTELNKITINDIACFVVDRDLKGFKIVSRVEADEYIQYVTEAGGLVTENNGNWKSIFTSVGIHRNEFEKWLLLGKTEKPYNVEERSYVVSTYGQKGTWTHPFIEKSDVNTRVIKLSDVVVIRLLNKIGSEDLLTFLQKTLTAFKKRSQSGEYLRLTVNRPSGNFNIAEIVENPDILMNIYKEENMNRLKKEDKLRNNIEHEFIRSLVRQACNISKNLRIKAKVEELKTIFRTKVIPPYFSSCFGTVHNILNEVIESVHDRHETLTSKNVTCKIPVNVDSILSLVSKRSNETLKSKEGDSNITKNTSGSARTTDAVSKVSGTTDVVSEVSGTTDVVSEVSGTTDVVSEVSGTTDVVSEVSGIISSPRERREEISINIILEKPLGLLTSGEVDLFCEIFEYQPGKCSILESENIILQDILEARHELSNYFAHLQEMLDFYNEGKEVSQDCIIYLF